jgi:uncharacterized protein YndB with AHSA1/START domain
MKKEKAMTTTTSPAKQAADQVLVITRDFSAPRDRLWKAWTNPHHVEQWWGPKGFTTRVPELDLRVGGRSRYVMVGPDGTEYPVKGVFREIVPGERIVTTDEFDEGFEQVMPVELPQGIVVTALFHDLGGSTRLTLRIDHPTAEDRRRHEEMGVVAGWNSSFDCLEEHLAKMSS